jgi:hypothetical protein
VPRRAVRIDAPRNSREAFATGALRRRSGSRAASPASTRCGMCSVLNPCEERAPRPQVCEAVLSRQQRGSPVVVAGLRPRLSRRESARRGACSPFYETDGRRSQSFAQLRYLNQIVSSKPP